MKRVIVIEVGTSRSWEVELAPGATAEDLLRRLDRKGYALLRWGGSSPLPKGTCLTDVLEDGDRVAIMQPSSVAAAVIAARAICARLTPTDRQPEPVWDRQAKVPGFDQNAMANLRACLVGAGALGGEIAEGLTRKGVGRLTIVDFDVVQTSNLSRQFFLDADIHSSKALCLVRNLQPHGYMGSELVGWPVSFEQAVELELDLESDVVISAVDDAQTRVAISRYAAARKIPAIFAAVAAQADHGVVFIQEVDGACFGCALPDQVEGQRTPCPGSPAVKDIMKTIGGVVLYAIDTLFMDRPRRWNLYDLSLADGESNRYGTVERRPDCKLCGGGDT